MITKVAFIAHPTRDMDAMKRFFGEALGLKQSADYAGKWAEFDTPEGKSIACDAYSPEGSHPYLALETDDISAQMAQIKAAGVKVLKDTWDNGSCKMAIIADPSGGTLMIHQIAPERLAAMSKAKAPAKAKPRAKAKARTKTKSKPKTKTKTKAKAKAKKRR